MEKIQGIIIRSVDYKEKDKILDIFTPNGFITVNARGVRSQKAKLRPFVSVMTFGEFVYSNTKSGNILSGVDCIDNFYSAWGDINKNSAISFCFELAKKSFYQETDTSEEFFTLVKTVNDIAYGNITPISLALKFMVFCARKIGADYSIIENYNEKVANILDTFAQIDNDEIETLSYSVSEIINSMMLLHTIFRNNLGITINCIKMLV